MVAKAKQTNFPGNQGASIYDIGNIFFSNLKSLRLGERSAAISFNFLLGIPPSLIFLFSLVPFLPLDSVQDTIINSLEIISPNAKLFNSAQVIIEDFMQTKRRELLSFGFLATIFVSSNGVMGLLRSFDRKSPALIERTGLARRWKSIKITFIIMIVLTISIALLILQSNLITNYAPEFFQNQLLIKAISWTTLMLIVYVTICIIYKYGPSINYKFKLFTPGATIATILFIVVTYGFFFIAANFLQYNRIYGSLGTLLTMMAWMFITGLVLLIGYEINLSIAMFKLKKDGKLEENEIEDDG